MAEPTVNGNSSNWISDGINAFFAERQKKREFQLEEKGIDATVRREELRAKSVQGVTPFNPSPGSLSNFPQRDAANMEGPMRLSNLITQIPAWAYVLVITSIIFIFVSPIKMKLGRR